MKKNYLYQFLMLLLFLVGCRSESYILGDSENVYQAKKYRIVPKSEIPQVISTLQTNTDSFKLLLRNTVSDNAKAEAVFGDISTNYIVESTDNSSEIYYTFPVIPRSENDISQTYNLEVKTDNKKVESAKVVVYKPTAEWMLADVKNYSSFSGDVSIYSLHDNLESNITYLAGIPKCTDDESCPECPSKLQSTSNLSKLIEKGNDNFTRTFIVNEIPAPCGGGVVIMISVQTDNLCEKTRDLMQIPEVREKIDELYSKSKTVGEKAFMVKNNGSPSQIINSDEHSVILKGMEGNKGVWHNHTPEGIKIASVRDIFLLFGFIKVLPAGTPASDAFIGMTGTQLCEAGCADGFEYFNYVIRFNGTAEEAGEIFSKTYDFETLGDDYKKIEMEIRNKSGYSSQYGNYINSTGLEEVFYDTLDNMGIDKNKMILQKIDKNGNVTNVTLGADGKPTDVVCP